MNCPLCSYEVVGLMGHRLSPEALEERTGRPRASLWGGPRSDGDMEVHPECCPGGCDSPEGH